MKYYSGTLKTIIRMSNDVHESINRKIKWKIG